ncbi:MAG: TVP38/TMEM64 family protein [Caulobacteraceae bacterium]
MDDQNRDLVTEIELTGLAQTPERRRLRLILRFGPAVLVLVAVAVLLRSGLLGRLSLEGLRESRGALLAFVQAHPVESLMAYVLVYVATVALSLPTALILTLTGGFLFGPWLGGSAAAVSCTLGATIVFLISRLAVGDAVEARTGGRARALAEEIKKDAFFYILTLRLIPVMPFWLTNVAAGLIAIRATTFAAATLIGIWPVGVIYAGVGAGLGSLFDSGQPFSLHALITPRMLLPLGGLAVLSVLPILYQRRRGRRRQAA